MREIKFRVWDKERKEMIGIRSIHFNTIPQIIACYCKKDTRGDKPIKKFILMQFTGLHDKHGKEIYERDIIKQYYGLDEIIFWHGAWQAKPINHKLSQQRIYNMCKRKMCEVIGNIYENEDLLDKETEK